VTTRRYSQLSGIIFALVLLCAMPVPGSAVADINAIYRAFKENFARGNYAAAIVEGQKLEAAVKARFGANHPDYAGVLENLAAAYKYQAKYAEAEGLYRRVLAIREQAVGANHPDIVLPLNGLAIVYVAQGKYAEAEGLFKRALAIREQVHRPDDADLIRSLNGLANVYKITGKNVEAEGLYERTLAIAERILGANHRDVGTFRNNLGTVYLALRKYAEAEGLFKRALAIREQALGPNHPDVAQTLDNLGIVYTDMGKYADAEGLYNRALMITEQALGANHPEAANSLIVLANVYRSQGKYVEAQELYERALAIKERAFGANHPDVAIALNNLANLFGLEADSGNALAYSRKATAAVIAHASVDAAGAGNMERTGGLIEQRAGFFVRHVANLAAAVRQNIEPEPAAGREALGVAQWAVQSSAGAAVQQMAARFATGSGALAALVREGQDLSAARRDKDRALLAALSKPQGQQDRAATDTVRKQIVDLDGRIVAVAARLDKQFPEYAALSNPKPLAAEEVRQLLRGNEALAFFLVGDKESYVFALTRESFDWRTIPIGANDLSGKVASFRHGLDVNELSRSIDAGKPVLFDLGLAYELYTALIGPIEVMVKDKPHLLIVPTGALTSLPFHLLVTEKPARPVPQVEDIATYRNAAWLIKRQAVTVLPSVASLQALRGFARTEQGTKPMVGFGDPVFDPAERAKALGEQRGGKRTVASNARGYSEFWQGAGVDRPRLAQALPSPLDTADELKAVAAKLGAPTADIHLDRDATETTVKHTALDGYRVVYFATHGLVAGDVKGLGEPSLALSLPAHPTELDDGLLTASEVAQLKLNADWVVLSACNTAAGDKPGAEALSGLARAFFYAGARALLVSHWSVASDAATRLTTSTFDIMNSDATVGRAEALRRAMLAYMNDERGPLNAYPGFWGPFSVVGEGAARRED
jgi:CHAT domain-containing protein/Tfp pilus assembly protein PilF